MSTVGDPRKESRSASSGESTSCRAAKLINELVEAKPPTSGQLSKTIARYGRGDLLCLDELEYMERTAAAVQFHVLTEREETASVAIASK